MAAWNRPEYAVFVRLSLASTEFRKIPRKHRNSMEMGKFHIMAQNSTFCKKTVVPNDRDLWQQVVEMATLQWGMLHDDDDDDDDPS